MDTRKETQNYNNILAIKYANDDILGFHTENLEVARLSKEIWDSMKSPSPLNELKEWSESQAQPDTSRPDAIQSHQTHLHQPTPRQSVVKSITLNVNQVCNLQCTYCAAGGDGSFGDPIKKISIEKTLPQISFFLNKLRAGDTFKITFLGGEPLLYPEALKIIGEEAKTQADIKGINLKFVVVTNGTQFNQETIAVLKELRASITISLDGPPKINDVLRPTKGGQGSTASIIQGLKLLLTHTQDLSSVNNSESNSANNNPVSGLDNSNNNSESITIGLSGVFGSKNMELEKAYQFYSEFNVDWFDFVFDHQEISAELSKAYTQKLKEVAAMAFNKGGEQELKKIRQFNTYFQILDSQVKNQNYCGTGNSYLMIDARNNIYVCPWSVGKKEDLVGSGTTLVQEKLKEYAATLVEQNNCGHCWAKNVCGGGCQFIHKNSTGNKRHVDKIFCERTQDLITETIMYYEKSRLKVHSNVSQFA